MNMSNNQIEIICYVRKSKYFIFLREYKVDDVFL